MTYRKYAQPDNRAYSVVNFKASDRDDGTIIGVASTPELDRVGDSLVPTGIKYQLPVPLLWQHNHSQPIGSVTSIKATSRGIEVVARIAVGCTEEIDRVYKMVKAGVVRGLSVGFRALEQPEITQTGYLFKKWELLELSVVSVPANAGAGISAVKSACGVTSVRHDFVPLSFNRGGGSVSLKSGSVSLRSGGDGSIKLMNPAQRQMSKYGVRLIRS